VLHDECVVGEAATVRDAILGAGVEVGDGAVVAPGSVIGAGESVD
jgi:carbonic anhydrase/acetyltransferase-like protein (isoleucine patch superfamily)